MYEYHVWTAPSAPWTGVTDHLNELGLQRWKLVSFCKTYSSGWTYIFVRALVPSVLTESTHDDEAAEPRVLS